MRLGLELKAKPKIGGCWGEAPGSRGADPDDGKRLRACEKRLELQCKAKPKIGGFGGRHRGALASRRMTERAFELARSDWSCCERRSLR